jgi:hypothetical protein
MTPHAGASGRRQKTASETVGFQALFEALNWAVALDERTAAHWAPEGTPLGWHWRERFASGPLIQAVSYARNSVHHQWSDALVWTPPAEVTPDDFDGRPDAFGSRRRQHQGLDGSGARSWNCHRPSGPTGRSRPRIASAWPARPVSLTLRELQDVWWKLWHFLERPRLFPEPSTPQVATLAIPEAR